MQVVTSDGNIFSMPGYEDVSGLKKNNQFADLISKFQAEKAKNDQSIWDGMTEVFHDTDTSSDEEKSESEESQDIDEENN